jgi:hypothetical protein
MRRENVGIVRVQPRDQMLDGCALAAHGDHARGIIGADFDAAVRRQESRKLVFAEADRRHGADAVDMAANEAAVIDEMGDVGERDGAGEIGRGDLAEAVANSDVGVAGRLPDFSQPACSANIAAGVIAGSCNREVLFGSGQRLYHRPAASGETRIKCSDKAAEYRLRLEEIAPHVPESAALPGAGEASLPARLPRLVTIAGGSFLSRLGHSWPSASAR